jgi:hypothetical protein
MYSQKIRQHTIRIAMLEWLDKTPPLWKEVVDQHFTTNADKILHTAVEWSKSKVSAGNIRYGPFEDDDDDMDDDAALSALPSSMSKNGANVSASYFHYRSAPPDQDEFISMLPRLQTALSKHGASQIFPKDTAPVVKPPVPRTTKFRPQLPPPSPQPLQYQFPRGAVPHHTPTYPFNFPSTSPYAGPGTLSSPGFEPILPPGTGRGEFGASSGFMGPGKTLGIVTQPVTRAPVSVAEPGRGRYDTRSSTRGRGGSTWTTPPGMSYGHFHGDKFGKTYGGLYGVSSQHWRGSGRGEQAGRGGRGDGAGRGVHGGFGRF